MSINDITNVNQPLDGDVQSSEFVGGDGIFIAPGPALFKDLNPEEGSAGLHVIVLFLAMDLNSSKNTITVGELGTVKKFLISMRGVKAMILSRLETEDDNILRAVYSYLIAQHPDWVEGLNYPKGPIWENLDHQLFKMPIGLSLTYVDGEPNNREIIGKLYLENCQVANIGGSGTEGQKGVFNNLTIRWAQTKYEPFDKE